MTTKPETPRQSVEGWARREMQSAATPAERDLMAMLTHRVASLFAPEPAPGRISAEVWANIVRDPRHRPDTEAGVKHSEYKSGTNFDSIG